MTAKIKINSARPLAPRCFLLNEIEKEEKEKLWYYSQLQGLSKRLDELPHVETVSARGGGRLHVRDPASGAAAAPPGRPSPRPPRPSQQFSMQMDLIRQQLEFEAQHIRSLMEERFGTSDEMVQRAQVRRGRGGAGRARRRANRSAEVAWSAAGDGPWVNPTAETAVGGAWARRRSQKLGPPVVGAGGQSGTQKAESRNNETGRASGRTRV